MKRLNSKFNAQIENDEPILDPIVNDVIPEFNPDIIHIWGSENPLGGLQKMTTIPCVIHIQGLLNPIVNKWYQLFSQYDIWRFSNIFRFSF